ncbi:putative leucine-rich repeat-containing protein DDB_G0290503 [Littorina saxatilis]|uniref:putative leucine-rich repeat-containing protein DDB_G0290503 n=1 Tax=Littorina saxatilis TaxID=31220 RepID=UPI0038B4AE13
MATGGYDSVVDSRVTCSVCLEPFKGRHPKLLPCFHTFCSPCLTQLTDRQVSQTLKSTNLTEDDGKKSHKATPVSIICPTCRSPTPLPPGGVSKLQGNFYLEHREEQAVKPPRYLCDLCEEGHDAKHTCAECLTYFCSRCQRTHDKICKKARVSGLNTKPAADGKEQPATNTDVDQVDMVEKVLKKLSEQENKLGQERRAREHDIHVRYVTLMRHAGEARDESLTSLRDVTHTMNDVIQIDVAMVRDTLSRLKQRRTDSVTGQQSSGCVESVISETNRRRLEELVQKNDDGGLLNYQPDDSFTEPLVRSLRHFMGSVLASGQGAKKELDESSGLSDTDASSGPRHSSLSDGRGDELESTVQQLQARHTHSDTLITTLQNQNALLCRDLASFHDEVSALKKEVASLREADKKLEDDTTSLRGDQARMQDKTSLLCQENQQLRTDLNSLQADTYKLQAEQITLTAAQDKLQTEQNSLEVGQDKLQTEQNTLKAGQDKLQTQQNSLKADQNKLQTEQNTLEVGQDKLQTQQTSLKAGHERLQKEQNTLKSAQDKFQTQQNTLRAGQDKLQTEQIMLKSQQDNLQTEQKSLKADHNKVKTKLQSDVRTVRSDVGNLKQNTARLGTEVRSLQDTLNKTRSAVTTLENQMKTASAQVAFHAVLNSTTIAEDDKTLICDEIISNVGGGYNDHTGVFTAPVSGCYCFMVTSCPCDSDLSIYGRLDIILDDDNIGYLRATGTGMCASHTAVHVNAGQKVWLRTYIGSTFYGNWRTTFTGVLLQPDL